MAQVKRMVVSFAIEVFVYDYQFRLQIPLRGMRTLRGTGISLLLSNQTQIIHRYTYLTPTNR